MSIELRAMPEKIEVRSDGGKRTVSGYAARFDVKSGVIAGSFREIIRPGAFRETLANNADVVLTVNHDGARLLARTKSGTLRLREDKIGLRFEADLPDTSLAKDVGVLVERGDLDSMSFAFTKTRDAWGEDEDGIPLRELLAVNLRDVTITATPAYPDGTSVSVREGEPALVELREWKSGRAADSIKSKERRLRLANAAMRIG